MMRKFRLFILIIGIFSFLGLKKAKAATPEKIDVEIYYYINGVKESAFTIHLSGILVGETITYNPQCYGDINLYFGLSMRQLEETYQNLSIKARSKLVLKHILLLLIKRSFRY